MDDVEKLARHFYCQKFPHIDDGLVDEHFRWYHQGKGRPDSCVHYSNVALAYDDARAALSALGGWNEAIEVAKKAAADQRKRWEKEADSVASVEKSVRYADMAFACGEVAKKIANIRRPATGEPRKAGE